MVLKTPFIAMIAGAIFIFGGSPLGLQHRLTLSVWQSNHRIRYHIKSENKVIQRDPAPFVMELPAYHIPTVGSIARSMGAWLVIHQKKARTIILLSTIVVWFTTYGFTDDGFRMLTDDEIDMSICFGW